MQIVRVCAHLHNIILIGRSLVLLKNQKESIGFAGPYNYRRNIEPSLGPPKVF